MSLLQKLDQITARYAELQASLSGGNLDSQKFVAASKEYSDLGPLVEAQLGRRPVIYSTPDAAEVLLAGLPHPIWMRIMASEPEGNWMFWQLDSGGSVPGISGPVDLDVFRRGRDALDSL